MDVMKPLTRTKARLDTMATNENLAKPETKLTNKFWSTMFAIAVMAAGLCGHGDQGLAIASPCMRPTGIRI